MSNLVLGIPCSSIEKEFPSFENKVLLVKIKTSQYILKTFLKQTSFIRERLTLEHLEGTSLSPKLYEVDEGDQSILIEFVEGDRFKPQRNADYLFLGQKIKELQSSISGMQDYLLSSKTSEPLYTTAMCIEDLESEINNPKILSLYEVDTCKFGISFLRGLGDFDLATSNGVIHGDIKPENIIGGKFIDFEKVSVDNQMRDLAKASVRFANDIEKDKVLFEGHGDFEYGDIPFDALRVEEALHSISYYIFKGYKNSYPYKGVSVGILEYLRTKYQG